MTLNTIIDVNTLKAGLAGYPADVQSKVIAELENFAASNATDILAIGVDAAKALLQASLNPATWDGPPPPPEASMAQIANDEEKTAQIDAQDLTVMQANKELQDVRARLWAETKKVGAIVLGLLGGVVAKAIA